jgi:hypothetical protein
MNVSGKVKESERERTIKAYLILGVDEDEVKRQPQISAQLGLIYRALKSKNMPLDPVYYLRASDTPEAHQIIDAYYSLSTPLRKLLPLEAFCFKAGIPTMRAMELITITAMRFGLQSSAIIAHLAHPDVVAATIEDATGYNPDLRAAAQTLLHKATGFLPQPRGNKTNIVVTQNAQTNASAQAAAITAPPPEATIRRLVDRFNDGHTLPAPSTPLPDRIVRDAETVDVEAD